MRPRRLPRMALVLAVVAFLLVPAAGCGSKKKAKKGMTIAKQLDDARREKTPDAKARKLLRVARNQVRAGDKAGAGKTLGEVASLVPAEGEAVVWGPRLVEIATVYADIEDRKPAKEMLRRGVERADAIEDVIGRIRVLADAGALYGAKKDGLSDAASAKATLQKARDALQGVEERFKTQALAAIAMGYTRADLAQEAGELVEELESGARAVEELRPKAESLAAAAVVRARTGAKAEAKKLLDEAAKAAAAIGDKGMAAENKVYALLAVAAASVEAGDVKSAATLLKQADKTVGQVPDPEGHKNALEKVRAMQADVEKRK